MKKKQIAYLMVGASAALMAWFVLELILILSKAYSLSSPVQVMLSGLLTGIILGGGITSADGFLGNDQRLLKRGLTAGSIAGGLGGIFSFLIIDLLQIEFPQLAENSFLTQLLYFQRWVVLALSIGAAFIYRDSKSPKSFKFLLTTIAAGIISGFSIQLISLNLPFFFSARGLSLLTFGVILSFSFNWFSNTNKNCWLRSLNGKLFQKEYDLSQDVHYLGTEKADDINVSHYQDVHKSHAKLVKDDSEYFLIDNDPFGRTFVNFRPVTEQRLKNGDLVKVGTALFQYCSKS